MNFCFKEILLLSTLAKKNQNLRNLIPFLFIAHLFTLYKQQLIKTEDQILIIRVKLNIAWFYFLFALLRNFSYSGIAL